MATLIILRGIPGSGKSCYARMIKTTWPGQWVIASADEYFMVDGKYKFDRKNLQKAHDFSYDTARRAIAQGKNVIVDNTNRRIGEFSRYMAIPGVNVIEIHRIMGDFGSTKGVPESVMDVHRNEYEAHPADKKKIPVL